MNSYYELNLRTLETRVHSGVNSEMASVRQVGSADDETEECEDAIEALAREAEAELQASEVISQCLA
jgi:hypothetical protein